MGSYDNSTAAQCLLLPVPAQQVSCSSQHLNTSDPPSTWGVVDYGMLWEPITCLLWNVTYSKRVNMESECAGGARRRRRRGAPVQVLPRFLGGGGSSFSLCRCPGGGCTAQGPPPPAPCAPPPR